MSVPGFIGYLVLLAPFMGYLGQRIGHIVATFTPEAQSRYNKIQEGIVVNYNLSIRNKAQIIRSSYVGAFNAPHQCSGNACCHT